MIAPGIFAPADAERQAGDSARNYLARAMRIVAEATRKERALADFPAEFALEFAPLIGAMVAAQAAEYRSWVLMREIGGCASSLYEGFADLGNVLEGKR